MTQPTCDKDITALLVVDPYNDFISEGGKIWPRIKTVAEANNCVPHMLQVLNAARRAKLRVFYAMHHRYRAGDYETWKYIAPIQKAAWEHKSFEYGTWGAEFAVGAPAGLTPKRHQSGETDDDGGVSKCGDTMLRAMLYEAAQSMLTHSKTWSWLKAWGMRVAQRRGMRRATVAVARRLAVILHRMWVDGTDFRWSNGSGAVAPAA
jgi:Transposase IS116/IS110/IS902 family/Isochorismatase family